MFEGDAKQLEKNIEYFFRYEQKKIDPYPSITHHPSPITHHPSVNIKNRGGQKRPITIENLK